MSLFHHAFRLVRSCQFTFYIAFGISSLVISIGYALLAMGEAISEMCPDGKDFFRQFDLMGGSSVGGAGVLLLNAVSQLPECNTYVLT